MRSSTYANICLGEYFLAVCNQNARMEGRPMSTYTKSGTGVHRVVSETLTKLLYHW